MAEKNVKFYKTKDGTIVVCKDEFARQQIEQLQGIWEAIEELPDGQAVSAQVAIHTTEIAALQSGKANINGSYEGMTVGMAKNIEAREIVSGIFTHRPTAGNAECATGAAKVRSIKGNSIAWEQLIQNGDFSNGVGSWACGSAVLSVSNNILTLTLNGSASNIELVNSSCGQQTANHVYAHFIQINPSRVITSAHKSYQGIINNIPANTWTTYSSIISRQEVVGLYDLYMFSSWEQGDTVQIKNIMFFDLTLMFGAGNEPATPEAFEAWLQASVGLRPYYAYNAGELLSAKLLGMKTVGFNQWDEQAESGYIDLDGTEQPGSNWRRSKNFIPVLPNTDYYIFYVNGSQATSTPITFYDSNKNFIGRSSSMINRTFTTPTNACYIKFYNNLYAFNANICINLHYTNGRDGEYEPYVEHEYNFDTSKVYGKLNGEGNYVQIFPDGLKSAGSARDELIINGGDTKAIKRVGSFDLGSATYIYSGNYFISLGLTPPSQINAQGICQCYNVKPLAQLSIANDKTIGLAGGNLYVRDTAYSDAATFKTAMNGVMLYYELAELAEYTDLVYRDNGVDVPLLDYFSGVILVDNYGTEEQLLESPTNNDPNSCAAGMDIVYGVNAAGFIDAANNGSFISKSSQDALLSTLSAALGGTLSATWNATTGHYDYTFTQNRQSNEEPHDD